MNDMTPIQPLVSEDMTTTSKVVAEAFGKQHKDVLKAVRNLACSDDFRQRNFAPIKNNDLTGEHTDHYTITRDGFSFLVMGFTGKRAAEWKEKFIAAFGEMERALRDRPALTGETLMAAAVLKAQATLEQRDKRIAEQATQIEAMSENVCALQRLRAAQRGTSRSGRPVADWSLIPRP